MDAPLISSALTQVGTTPQWAMHTVLINGFASLSTELGVPFNSPGFMLLGNQWTLQIYPGGDPSGDNRMVYLELRNMSDKGITIERSFSVIDGDGQQVAFAKSYPRYFDPVCAYGYPLETHSTLMQSLDEEGTLAIQVRMRLPVPSTRPYFILKNPSSCNVIQELHLDEKYSDVLFKVGEKVFPAHRNIVTSRSQLLADLCESVDGMNPIQIDNVSEIAFHHVLCYMYGKEISDNEMISCAKEIIDAADWFGLVSLKIVAEVRFVEGTTVTMENVMDLLLYAESKNCALMKEVLMNFVVENKLLVLDKISFDDAPGTWVREIIAAMARAESMSGGADVVNVNNQYNVMCISELRSKAQSNGLNVDGSREMLIAALKPVTGNVTK